MYKSRTKLARKALNEAINTIISSSCQLDMKKNQIVAPYKHPRKDDTIIPLFCEENAKYKDEQKTRASIDLKVNFAFVSRSIFLWYLFNNIIFNWLFSLKLKFSLPCICQLKEEIYI
jgi:hypothetical protein